MTPNIFNGMQIGILCFVVGIFFIAIGLRTLKKVEPALLVVLSAFFFGVLGLCGLIFWAKVGNIWAYVITYSCLSLIFLMGFGAVYKSLSLRILLDLSKQPNMTDSYVRIYNSYLINDSFVNRLEVIKAQKFATENDHHFSLTPRGRALSSRVRTIQQIFGIENSG
jgi:hypothetical protein